jgi:hypothetical protein
MPSFLNAEFPEADYNHSSGSKSSSNLERIDTESEYKDEYLPKSKIILADKPSSIEG